MNATRVMRRSLLVASVAAGALVVAAAESPAGLESLLQFDSVRAEPVRLARRGNLVGPRAVPTSSTCVILVSPRKGEVTDGDLQSARADMAQIAQIIAMQAKAKFGIELPFTSDVRAIGRDDLAAERETLERAGFSLFRAGDVPRENGARVIHAEIFRKADFPPDGFLGDAIAQIEFTPQPEFASPGVIKLGLSARVASVEVGAVGAGVIPAEIETAKQRFAADTLESARALVNYLNARTWRLPERDLRWLAAGNAPLKKAIPIAAFGATERLQLLIEAHLPASPDDEGLPLPWGGVQP